MLRVGGFTASQSQKTKGQLTTAGCASSDAYVAAKIPVPLPEIDEQRRIAADKADELRVRREATLEKTDRLTDQLFIDMFGDPASNPLGWKRAIVGDVVHSALDGPRQSYVHLIGYTVSVCEAHTPRKSHLGRFEIHPSVDAEQLWRKCKPEKGDILLELLAYGPVIEEADGMEPRDAAVNAPAAGTESRTLLHNSPDRNPRFWISGLSRRGGA